MDKTLDPKEEMIKLINQTYNTYHSKIVKLNTEERLKNIGNVYLKLLELAKNNFLDEATKYYKTRSKSDKKLLKIQQKSLNEIKKCLNDVFPDYYIMPASSFSSKTHLVGDSDIDLMIRIKSMTFNDIIKITNKLGNCGYIFKSIGTPEDEKLRYIIHGKIINGVEIEVKVRDYEASEFIANLHKYLDSKLTKEQQIFTTYIKYLMKNGNYKDEYWKFKLICYEYGLYKTKSSLLLLPLV
jgi:hypothetical protein